MSDMTRGKATMKHRQSSLQAFVVDVIDTAGASTMGQLVWARNNLDNPRDWVSNGSEMPSLTARQNRSSYNSVRRSTDALVSQGILTKDEDGEQTRYRRRSTPHLQRALALSSLAQAKLGDEHYERLLEANVQSRAVLEAVCAATGWTPMKTRMAVDSLAQVIEG